MQNNYGSFVPVKIYTNALTDKSKILSDNKGKAGIYLWTLLESPRSGLASKIYVGSAFNLSIRLYQYYVVSCLKAADNYICRSILHHTHEAFSLAILEYIDISSLDLEQAREKILEREQYFLDKIFSVKDPNIFNINPTAGSRLGSSQSEGTKALLSEINKGDKNPRGMLGKFHSEETIAKISSSKTKKVIVYSLDLDTKSIILYKSFDSCSEAALYFDSSTRTISRYLDKNKVFKEQWILSSSSVSEL